MPLPRIAIVGRPNVGKSSLFNRLAGRRVSIVDATPGVTRDRVARVVEIDPPVTSDRGTPSIEAELVDTGGYGVYVAEGARFDDVGADLATLTPDIEHQIRTARLDAEVILFVVDAQAGITALDETVARIIREESPRGSIVMVANKVDSEAWVPHGLEAAAFGHGEPMLVSTTSNRGVRELIDRIHGELTEALVRRAERGEAEPEADDASGDLRVAIVGKRNAGKSTLVNALCGEPRMIVSEIAGTTRDAVDVRLERDGRSMLLIDTAGLRKKKSFADDVEYYAFRRMCGAIERAQVCLFLVDATVKTSQVDAKLSQILQDAFVPTIIVVNKTDLVEDAKAGPEEYAEYLSKTIKGLDYAPIVFMSAKNGEGLDELVEMIHELHEQASHREPTAAVNKAIEEILDRRGPSSRLGKQAKLYYASQVAANPPTIVLKVNRPELFEGRYERYLMNRIRETLPFPEVPIKLLFSGRTRKELQEMKDDGRRRARASREAGTLVDADGSVLRPDPEADETR